MRTPPAAKPYTQRPGVVFQPAAHEGLQHGVNLMVDAIRPTLGPLPRFTCLERILRNKTPEILDSGGTIAKRILEIPGRDADMGAMFVRHMLWRLQDKTGDGTATAAVIFQSIYNQGIAYLAAGGSPMRLRFYLEEGMKLVLLKLEKAGWSCSGQEQLANFAESVCNDTELSQVLGEVFDVLGPYGRLEIRSGRRREITREYVHGVYWEEGLLSARMALDAQKGGSALPEGGVLATDLEIEEPEDMIHVLELALEAGLQAVLLIVKSISDRALGVALIPQNWQKVKILAVKTPGNLVDAQLSALNDIAILTGGRVVLKTTHTHLRHATLDDFGAARKIWANRETFGFTTGKGDPSLLRRYVRDLQKAYRNADKVDERDKLLLRIGRLLGGSATLWIGALSQDDYENRKALAEHASRALRSALIDGVVPGGGCAYLACLPVLEDKLQQAVDSDERAAYRILLRALEEPFRSLMANSGYSSGQIHSLIRETGYRRVYDLRSHQIVDPQEAGLLDSAGVAHEAVRSAISSAALLLTTDILVHRRNPPQEYNT